MSNSGVNKFVETLKFLVILIVTQNNNWGSGGAMVLSKLSVPGRPTYSENSSARAYCACSR